MDKVGEDARRAAVTGGKPTSCWISSTATERGDLRAACTAGWHPTLPMSGSAARYAGSRYSGAGSP
jgi:hypothetical protein